MKNNALESKVKRIKREALKEIQRTSTFVDVENLRVKYLGRKSELVKILKSLKGLSLEERKTAGSLSNLARKEIEEELERAKKRLQDNNLNDKEERVDVTLPTIQKEKLKRGHLHVLTLIQNEIEDIFSSMGFEVADGPEVETEFYNFDALNIPADHPARDKWDTFWLKNINSDSKERIALRPHTSPVQIRYMQKNKPPIRIIAPGKCFRCEATDATHEHTFYQFEALMVDKNISVGNFKYIGEQFFSQFFKKDIKVRLRPSYFPFTEPSFEFDISCTVCGGQGCKSCKGGGWLEVGGAGMVNQNVFVASGYKRNQYQGFAWGFGLERLAMMKYKIDDIRLFHGGNLRFITQF